MRAGGAEGVRDIFSLAFTFCVWASWIAMVKVGVLVFSFVVLEFLSLLLAVFVGLIRFAEPIEETALSR